MDCPCKNTRVGRSHGSMSVNRRVLIRNSFLRVVPSTVSCAQVIKQNSKAAAARADIKTLPSGKDDARLVLPPPNRFAAGLCAILGSSAPGEVLPVALLLAHHPLVCHSAKGAVSLWGGIVRRAFGGRAGVDRCLTDEGISATVTTDLLRAMHGGAMLDR